MSYNIVLFIGWYLQNQQNKQPLKTPGARYSSTQSKAISLRAKAEVKINSSNSLLEILKSSSISADKKTSEDQSLTTESQASHQFSAFKLVRKSSTWNKLWLPDSFSQHGDSRFTFYTSTLLQIDSFILNFSYHFYQQEIKEIAWLQNQMKSMKLHLFPILNVVPELW